MDSGAAQTEQREAQVRDFYERLPYPAPVTSLDEHRDLCRNPERRRALFHRIWPAGKALDDQNILIAGCGTSQAARYAIAEPKARVTAIDISETSLRHTRQLQRKYQLENLTLHRLPIERVGELGQDFDLIVCTGVLHHLPDPDLGLSVLREVLRPNGAMQLMVYATYGRLGIYMIQEYCRMLGISTSERDLRELGAALGSLPADHPIAGVVRRAKDFLRPASMADALLHPRDRSYTVPELYAWLERCGVVFGRWIEQAPYLAQCGLVARSSHAARMAALPERAQYAAVELFRGTMTRHRFIAYASDEAARERPISFAGERWLDYVPLRLPWTRCVRDQVPAGSVAVLWNPASGYPDLILPIHSTEDRILGHIDGQRTLREIVHREPGQSASRVLQFFERLWQHDQIVFDLSRAGAEPSPRVSA